MTPDDAIAFTRTVLVMFEVGELSRDQQRAVLAVLCSALHCDDHPKFKKQVLRVAA